MNVHNKTGEILECIGWMAGCHPVEAEKIHNKLIQIIKEANKELRYKIIENINGLDSQGDNSAGESLIVGEAAIRDVMNTNLDLE